MFIQNWVLSNRFWFIFPVPLGKPDCRRHSSQLFKLSLRALCTSWTQLLFALRSICIAISIAIAQGKRYISLLYWSRDQIILSCKGRKKYKKWLISCWNTQDLIYVMQAAALYKSNSECHCNIAHTGKVAFKKGLYMREKCVLNTYWEIKKIYIQPIIVK